MAEKLRRKSRNQIGILPRVLLAGVCFAAIVAIWCIALGYRDYQARQHAYDVLILNAGARHGVDPALIKAVIWRESRFRPLVRGKAGEIGLMQVMPDKAATDWANYYRYPVPNRGALSSPEMNIEVGSWYLSNALRRWKPYKDRIRLALCEYNAGYSRANAWKPLDKNGDVMPRIAISSTYSYVNAVMDKYAEYRKSGFRKTRQNERK